MIVRVLIAVTAALCLGAPAVITGQESGSPIELVALPVKESPLVSVRLMFRAGSAVDPEGKEGLAALTALMVGDSGTATRTYAQLVDALYPMAADIDVLTDREVIVLAAQVHRETLDEFASLLREVVLAPGFREDDFRRHRDQLRAFLTATLRSANDELLGLEMIQQRIFEGHPYGHSPAGTIESLDRLTIDDVKAFYRDHYTKSNLIVGVAGGYDHGFSAALVHALDKLPAGTPRPRAIPEPSVPRGRHYTIVDKPTASVSIHFGYPLRINRADADFYPLMVANSYLGEHRTFHGRLMQELRGKRGLNYGDYSYLEYWDNPPGTTNPPPNTPRREQYFSVWVRPVAPAHAIFALRAALSEVNRLKEQGLTAEAFELSRDFLINYSKLWARTLTDRLGFHMDSRFYGMPYFIDHIETRLRALTLDEVNATIRRYVQTENFSAVLIAGDAAALEQQLRSGAKSSMHYSNPVDDEVLKADASIATLALNPAQVTILPIEQTFTGQRSAQKPR